MEQKLKATKLFRDLEKRDNVLASDVLILCKNASEQINHLSIINFPKYTLHDINHSIRIIEYMGELVSSIDKLSPLEIAALMYSAILHDIGMSVDENIVRKIENDNFTHVNVKFSRMLELKKEKEIALQEFIRRYHSEISNYYCINNYKEYLTLHRDPTLCFADLIGKICQSHTCNIEWIKENIPVSKIIGNYVINAQFVACLLRISDILDIDNKRAPYNLYKALEMPSISDGEWKMNYDITNYQKVFANAHDKTRYVRFDINTDDVNVYWKIMDYIGWVEKEIKDTINICDHFSDEYKILLNSTIEKSIGSTKKFLSSVKLQLSYKEIRTLLIGENLYGSKKCGIRELIQNSIDATRTRLAHENKKHKETSTYQPAIFIIVDKRNNKLIIHDNGIGMNYKILTTSFLTIGYSYYKTDDFFLENLHSKPIGRFGIGFLSSFMLSKDVVVNTRHLFSSTQYSVSLNKNSEHVVIEQKSESSRIGTEVLLNLNEVLEVFGTIEELRDYISETFVKNIDVPIKFINEKISEEIGSELIIKLPSESSINIISKFDKYFTSNSGILTDTSNNFFSDFYDYRSGLGFGEIIYLKQGNNLVQYDPKIHVISDYLVNGNVNFINAWLLDDERKVNEALKYYDSLSDVVERLEYDFEFITIILDEEIEDKVGYGFEIDNSNPYLGITHEWLVEQGNSKELDGYITVDKVPIFFCEDINEFSAMSDGGLGLRRYNYKDEFLKVYNNGIHVPEFKLRRKKSLRLFSFETIRIDCLPNIYNLDVSRNRFTLDDEFAISEMIHRYAHESLLSKDIFSKDQKKVIKSFLERHYS